MGLFKCGSEPIHVHSETVTMTRNGNFTVNVGFEPISITLVVNSRTNYAYACICTAIKDNMSDCASLGGADRSVWGGVESWGKRSVTINVPNSVVRDGATGTVYVIG